jgi:hypothetical protein
MLPERQASPDTVMIAMPSKIMTEINDTLYAESAVESRTKLEPEEFFRALD